jgi:lipid-A-disaccharide synthase
MNSYSLAGDRRKPLSLFLVAGEASGDVLGASLMRALRQRTGGQVQFAGVGGREMSREGLASLYSIEALSIIGFSAIPRRLPRILRLMNLTVKEALARKPDALIIIDSPAFTLPIARRVRAADPTIATIEYVSPSVWAWHPGRAPRMRRYIDHILAVMPFEPEVHQRLGGPPCTYVGHPLGEAVHRLRPSIDEARRRLMRPPVLLVLPGSRAGEIRRLGAVFGKAAALAHDQAGPLQLVVPTVPHLAEEVTKASRQWRVQPRIVVENGEKELAFRTATAALAKSGTVTLELALAGVPMVAAYKVSAVESVIGRRIVKRIASVILANLMLGENVIPELLQEECTAEKLAAALTPLLTDSPDRRRQLAAFSRLDAIMQIGSRSPAATAADVVIEMVGAAKGSEHMGRGTAVAPVTSSITS